VFDITHETESARTTDFVDEGGGRKVNRGGLSFFVECRVIEVNGKTDLETFERLKTGPLVTIPDFDSSLDANELFGCIQLLNACGLNQEHKRPGAAIHDGQLVSRQFDNRIVNAEAGHG